MLTLVIFVQAYSGNAIAEYMSKEKLLKMDWQEFVRNNAYYGSEAMAETDIGQITTAEVHQTDVDLIAGNGVTPLTALSVSVMLAGEYPGSPAMMAYLNKQEPVKPKVYVHRDLITENGSHRLYITTGVWEIGAGLDIVKQRRSASFQGYQKGNAIKLSSFDAEIGLEVPPLYRIEGTVDTAKNIIDATFTDIANDHQETLRFQPEIPVADRPSFNLKFFGRKIEEWPYENIERIEIVDLTKDNQVVQTLTGFSASGYSLSYEDINYDGYFDIILSTPETSNERYIYWLFNPTLRVFERNIYLEMIQGHPHRFPRERQINFGSGKLYEVIGGELKRIPCCYRN